jgi:SAM-dependent methyltransferase
MSGRVPPLSYPATYQREMSPTWLNYAAVACGARPRDFAKAFRYLEIGCGRGWSTLVHAASHPQGQFFGCDLDPEAIASAEASASQCAVENVSFRATSFADPIFADGPGFDFIALHGVYSWVGEETRAAIRAFLRDRLAPNGLAYVSYNAQPGWASELALAHPGCAL